MDQGRDPVTGTPAAPPLDTTRGSKDPDAIAHDIRETRAEMDETIDALGRRLDPSHLADQAKDVFTSQAKDYGSQLMDAARDSSVVDTIKDNPVPAIAVGLSVAWFLSKVGESEADRHRHERYVATGDPYYAPRRRSPMGYDDGYGRYAYDPYTGARIGGYDSGYDADGNDDSLVDKAKDKASDAVDAVKDTAGDLADSARDAAGSAKDRASGLAGGAGDRARGAGQQARRYERRAESWLDRQMTSNPLAVGAVAMAAGALVGLSIPETDAENEAMGDRADALKAQAGAAASEKIEQARHVAEDVAETAGAEARKVADDAKAKAQDVADEAKSKAKDVASDAKSEAKDKDLGKPPSTVGSSSGSSGSSTRGSTSSGSKGSTPSKS